MQAVRTAGVVDRVKRRFERHKADLQLLVDETGDLKTLLAKDVSEGGMFVATTLPMPIGHAFCVTVVHPQNGAHFLLDCIVRRREPGANPPGVGVQFVGMDAAVHADFLAFIANELPVLSVGEEEVDEDQIDAWEEEEPTNVRPRTIPR